MSTAAGLGALGEGIIRGMKLGSDMNDAEQRRGLMGLQMKREQAAIDKEAQFNDLSKQLAQEYTDLRDGKGAYAPAEGQTYNPADPRVGDIHYSRIEPLLKQQAALSGKNPELVSKELRDLRRERYAENVFRAAQLFDAGDVEGGTAVLQPLYNRVFTDGTDVKGVAYNKANDSLSMTLLRDGKESVVDMPRAKLVDMLTYGALNTGDAVRFRVQRADKAEDRKFEAGERDKDRGLKRELNESDNRAAMQRTQATVSGGIRQAEIGRESRISAGANAREERNEDDVVKGLPLAFGYDPKNQLQADGERDLFSARSSQALSIFKTTKQIAKDIPPPDQYGLATIVRGLEKDPKTGKRGITKENIREIPGAPGYFAVDYKGVQAVVPPGIISK